VSVAEMERTLRARAAETKSKMEEVFNGGVKSEDGGLVVDPARATEYKKLVAESAEILKELKGIGAYQDLNDFLNAPAGQSVTAQPGAGAAVNTRGAFEAKSLGQQFTESEVFQQRDRSSGRVGAFELKSDMLGLERKDIYTGAGGTLTSYGFGTVDREPIVLRPFRTARVRDLFPTASTTSNLIEYVRVLGYLDGVNNAATVPERDNGTPQNFGLKPHTSLAFQPAQAPIRTIAHYEVAHRNTLDDEPQLQSIIDNELLYGLRLAEDDQLLNGDGSGENMLGILQTPGIQQYPGSPIPTPDPRQSTDTYVDAVRRAATRIMLAYYEPTGVVVHPFDWEAMELTKDSMGNYIVAVNVSVGGEKRIWQMPVVASPAMTQGTALIGAFGLGAKIYDRQQSNIRVAEQHADLFLRNAVAVLAEERVGMTVSRPESFILVDLATATAL
jgi:HK97 family phage major capsid protein